MQGVRHEFGIIIVSLLRGILININWVVRMDVCACACLRALVFACVNEVLELMLLLCPQQASATAVPTINASARAPALQFCSAS